MTNEIQVPTVHNNNILGVLVGILIGGLAGAAAMLLLAPQSGKDTRTQIQKRGIELRDRSNGMVEDALAQVRVNGSKIIKGGRQKAKELLQQDQALAVEQVNPGPDAAQAEKKATKNS